MLNLTPAQHAQLGCDYIDELLHTLESQSWCFQDTFGIETRISEHAQALGIPAPFERPAKPEHETAEELQIWLKMHDPLTNSRYERLIERLIFAPPPASKGTVLKTLYRPLGEQEQRDFRQFVERLKRELRRHGAIASDGALQEPTPAQLAAPGANDPVAGFNALLDEYIGYVADTPSTAEFSGHFVLEEKINTEAQRLGIGPIFQRQDFWKHEDGGVGNLMIFRPHNMGHTVLHDLPLRRFRENFPAAFRDRLIAIMREWQRLARTKAAGGSSQEKPAGHVDDQQQAPPGTEAKPIAIEGHFSPAELATKYAVEPEATRKALDRWRSKNAGGDGYTENPDRRPNEPQFLYSLKAVAPVMDGLKNRAERRQIRRTKTSGQRPAKTT